MGVVKEQKNIFCYESQAAIPTYLSINTVDKDTFEQAFKFIENWDMKRSN